MGLCEHIECMVNKFLWVANKANEKFAQKNVSHYERKQKKKKGGIGFRTFHVLTLQCCPNKINVICNAIF